jgi:hypothetical protein
VRDRRSARSLRSRTPGSTRMRRFPISAISATRRSVQERTSARDRLRQISITTLASPRSAR